MTEHFYDQLQVLEEKDGELDQEQRLRAMARPLLSWYEGHRRILPWREEPTPYRVWVSEIMLQQTRVEAVKPYFARFMEELPDVPALAGVEEGRLMKLWEGLGYYSRARNLKKAAGEVMERYGGRLPASYKELLSLPGIGSYTAGAIASIAFGLPEPAVDGNVLRVVSRYLGDRGDIRKASVKAAMEERLRAVIPRGQASQYNQGLIEAGALVCIPSGEPKCGECPLASLCAARREGLWREIPVRSPLKKRRAEEMTVLLAFRGGEVALRQRPGEGLLASLYELPNCPGRLEKEEVLRAFGLKEGEVQEIKPLGEAKHVFSHVEWHMIGYAVTLTQEAQGREGVFFAERERARREYALPGAFKAYARFI